MQSLVIDEHLAQQIRQHGAGAYPHECCGALLGIDGEAIREVRALYMLVNRQTESSRNRFLVSSDDVREAERAAQKAGLEVVGWYHSHPDHPAIPSEFDRLHAWPWYSYVIVSVAAGKAETIASWRLADDRMRFEPERISGVVSANRAAVSNS